MNIQENIKNPPDIHTRLKCLRCSYSDLNSTSKGHLQHPWKGFSQIETSIIALPFDVSYGMIC